MAAKTGPRNGVLYGWAAGESGYNLQMDANLQMLDALLGGIHAIDRDLTSPPGSPSDGDSYIVGPSATGDWSGKDNEVAVWNNTESTWVFFTPKKGWTAYIEDEDVYSTWKGSSWSTGIAA